jgi:arylsulfatase A-like enzyme
LLLWIFSAFPRFWFFYQENYFSDSWGFIARSVFIGFLRDGVLFAPCLLFYQIFHRKIYNFPFIWVKFAHIVLTVFSGFLVGLMMANVEFFRYFGSNANLSHFTFISDSEILVPSLEVIFPLKKILFALVFLPLLFIVLVEVLPSWKINLIFQKKMMILFPFVSFIVAYLAPLLADIKDPLQRNLQQNYVVSFMKYALFGDEIGGKATEPIEKVLDTRPLKSEKIKSPEWYYFDPKYPLVQATAHHLCQMGIWKGTECEKDFDGDKFPVKTDCNDLESFVHPGGNDLPGNGIDEDCSGLDENPPNIIFIHWEGARALNVGSIGFSDDCTPKFNELSKKGLLFRNAYCNGTQTRWSLTSVYNSILPRLSSKWIFKHNPELQMNSFPLILRNYGYHNIYIHSGDINFGSLKNRFWEYFETMFDKKNEPIKGMEKLGWGIRDKDLLDFSYKVLKERKDSRPFYLTIATLSLHHPFPLPDPKYAYYPHTSMGKRYKNILRYSDAQVGAFVDKILNDKQFENTIIIIAADHGMNTGEPHLLTSQSTLWEDLVWVPVLLIGKKWNIAPGINDEVRQLADIGPTILDRLGIEVPNHFIGHSLLRKFTPDRRAVAFFGNSNGGLSAGVRMNEFKYFTNFESGSKRFFNIKDDRREQVNLVNDQSKAALVEKYYKMVTDVYVQHTRLIKENRIWNWKYGMKVKRPVASSPSNN